MIIQKINKMETEEKTNENGLKRRKFLRFGFGFLAAVGIISSVGGVTKIVESKSKKVKMLTPDGKLVEIDASILEKDKSPRATNAEVQQWMTNKSE